MLIPAANVAAMLSVPPAASAPRWLPPEPARFREVARAGNGETERQIKMVLAHIKELEGYEERMLREGYKPTGGRGEHYRVHRKGLEEVVRILRTTKLIEP